MTFARDLAWQSRELAYQSSVTYQFARYALGLNYEWLPPAVVHQAKRCLLDALACGIGGYSAPGRPVIEAAAREMGGPEEATIFGSGLRTSALNVTLVNSFMVRQQDYNDVGGGGHGSDAIPAILAVAEREKAGGQDFLTSLVIAYELGARHSDSTRFLMMDTGFQFDIMGGLNMPPALGKLMGLNEDQIANAMGICASHSFVLGVLEDEEHNMSKDIRFGFVAHDAVLSCILAKNGFTGPVRVVEGKSGLRDIIYKGNMDLERLVDFSGWRIPDTWHKFLRGCALIHAPVFATLAIVKEQDLKPEDIAAVRIKVHPRVFAGSSNLIYKYPRNAESADHSIWYTQAIAIKERVLGPDSFEPEKFTDLVVLDLIDRVTVEADPNFPASYAGLFMAISEITTKDGRWFQKRVDVPHGMGDDPLTDGELEEKFREMATKYMGEEQISKIFDTVWNVESLDDMSKLARLIVF